MLTSELYQAYVDAVDKFDKYIREHPEVIEEAARKYAEQFVDIKDVALGDKVPFTRDCRKCAYEVGCHGNPVGCKDYKRDVPDGGYYV